MQLLMMMRNQYNLKKIGFFLKKIKKPIIYKMVQKILIWIDK